MRRVTQLFLVAALAALLSPAVASSAPRMYVGFHDDVAFRWNDNRTEVLDQARGANATIVRTLVDWSKTAPTRPSNAANPLDPAYRFSDIDELVRNAQQRGLEVIITIWGTPKWANGGKTPNNVPRNVNDLKNFSRAVAARYSGRYAQYPFVGRYSVWNESNLQLFLSPQFDSKGRSVGPRLYAKMYAAAYSGIKAGNSRAQVAIGSTSSHGRDKKLNGKSDTHSPGRFAQLVAAANPRLKFSAWAQHPYPTPQNLKPTQKVKWPNVTLSSLPRFEQSLDKWFKRKNVRIWITEFGHETKLDGEPKGVSRAQQASYTTQAIGLAKKDPRVDMFVWFIFRDDETSVWQSGLQTKERRREARPRALPLRGEVGRRQESARQGSRRDLVSVRGRAAARADDEPPHRRHRRDQLPRLPARQAGRGRPAGDEARLRRGRPLPADGLQAREEDDVCRPARRQHRERRARHARADDRRVLADAGLSIRNERMLSRASGP